MRAPRLVTHRHLWRSSVVPNAAITEPVAHAVIRVECAICNSRVHRRQVEGCGGQRGPQELLRHREQRLQENAH